MKTWILLPLVLSALFVASCAKTPPQTTVTAPVELPERFELTYRDVLKMSSGGSYSITYIVNYDGVALRNITTIAGGESVDGTGRCVDTYTPERGWEQIEAISIRWNKTGTGSYQINASCEPRTTVERHYLSREALTDAINDRTLSPRQYLRIVAR
jgi:hypothetical protein